MTDQRHPDGGNTIDAEVVDLILAHRKASMTLGQVMQSNGRRGGSQSAADEINRAGYAMAKTERELDQAIRRLAAADRAVTRGDCVTISREGLEELSNYAFAHHQWERGCAVETSIRAALATPTETTDAEGDDEQG